MTRITIKIGSNVLTREDGSLDVTRMSALVDQIAFLRKNNIEVILVSSGAVASGRSELHLHKTMSDVSERQLYSAVGQAKLINRYYELFRDHKIAVGQVLTMKENFNRSDHFQTQQNCMMVMLENNVIPIVNENDTVSVTELMFTDNDELAGLVTEMMNSEMLIILSNIDGIFSGDPSDGNAQLIPVVKSTDDISNFIQKKKSSAGRGGMHTKTTIAQQLASKGIKVMIANGKRENILVDLIQNAANTPHTEFVV
ncbi:MAG: glutamate 5-kinase [Bacteroidaceae bacterium]|nr:glutamate 5-kinase [Bacteroidaceae bacterium]